jgi:BlaI family transcriptional regulator, penicillinase repressor
MARPLSNATEAEWNVLEQLWNNGPASVRQLTEVLYPKGGPSECATVHKLLERLEAKGYVRRDREGGVFIFRAAVGRDEIIGQQLETLVEKMCGGSLQPLLLNLVRVKRLKPEELRDLLNLVDDLDAKSKRKKERG